MKKTAAAVLLVLFAVPLNARAVTIIKPPELKFSGYSQFGYNRDNSTTVAADTATASRDYSFEDNYRLLKARLTFKAEIDPMVSMNVQFDVADRDNNNVKNILTDGYFDLKYLKGHNIRIGQFKLPFGLENPISDARTFPVSASLIKTKACNTRDIGIDISGKKSKYEYHAAVINGTGQNKSDDNSNKDYVASVQAPVSRKVKVGGSVLAGAGSPTQTSFRHAVDGFVLWSPPIGDVSFEYAKGRDRSAVKQSGWYLMATPQLNGRTWLVLRQDKYDRNRADGGDMVSRTTLGLLYKASKYSLIKVNYEWRDDEAKTNAGNAFRLVWQVEY